MGEHGYIPGSDPRDKREPGVDRYRVAQAIEWKEDADHCEDKIVARSDLGLIAAIDGAGGHADGEKAAEITASIIEATVATYLNHAGTTPEVLIKHALIEADLAVAQYNEQMGSNAMAAAALALCYEKDGNEYAAIASLGDARIYVLSADGSLRCVTVDNVDNRTHPQDVVQANINQKAHDELTHRDTEDAQEYFRKRNEVTHMAGLNGDDPRVTTVALMPGDILIATSDGIHDVLTQTQMQRVASDYKETPQAIAHGLLGAARKEAKNSQNVRGKADDRSVAVLAPISRDEADKPTGRNDIITEIPVFETETHVPHPEKYPGKHEIRLEKNGTEEIPLERLEGPIEISLVSGIGGEANSFEVHFLTEEGRVVVLQKGHKPIEYATGKGFKDIEKGSAISLGRKLGPILSEIFHEITDANVSRQHVGILYEEGKLIISDLNTLNHCTELKFTLT